MTIRKLVYLPDMRLRELCKPIGNIDDNLQRLIDDMFDTMYDAPGVGLAAPQIGVNQRLSVIDVSEEKNQPMVLINPEVLAVKGTITVQEGCLSVPGGIYDQVKRASWVKMAALDRKGNRYEVEAEGLLAQCIQHEIDHLDGKLFIDQLSALKRLRIRQKVEKFKRQQRLQQSK